MTMHYSTVTSSDTVVHQFISTLLWGSAYQLFLLLVPVWVSGITFSIQWGSAYELSVPVSSPVALKCLSILYLLHVTMFSYKQYSYSLVLVVVNVSGKFDQMGSMSISRVLRIP